MVPRQVCILERLHVKPSSDRFKRVQVYQATHLAAAKRGCMAPSLVARELHRSAKTFRTAFCIRESPADSPSSTMLLICFNPAPFPCWSGNSVSLRSARSRSLQLASDPSMPSRPRRGSCTTRRYSNTPHCSATRSAVRAAREYSIVRISFSGPSPQTLQSPTRPYARAAQIPAGSSLKYGNLRDMEVETGYS